MQNFIKDYILDNEFRLNLYQDRINIINYKDLIEINDNKLTITSDKMKIYVKGNNLVLNKLLDNEILVSGKVLSLEVKYE